MRNVGFVAIILSFCLIGCDSRRFSGANDKRAWTTTDSWYAPQPLAENRLNAEPVWWREVTPSGMAEAEEKLANVAFIQIAPADADRLLGGPLSRNDSLKLFLVRGVCLLRDTGGFTVTYNGRDLFVDYGCLGRSPVPMNRQPLIVALPSAPSHVCVSTSMAE